MVNLALKKEKFWLITFTGLFSFFLFLPPFFLFLNESDWIESNHFNLQWITTSKEVALKAGETIGQSFVAESNNLAKIAVRMHRGGKDSQSEYQFSLKEDPFSPENFKKGTFPLQKIFRTAYFEFEPIKDSQRKTFYFSIQPMPDTKEPLGFFIAENNLSNGDYYLNEQKQAEQDLVFQVYYKNPLNFRTFWSVLFNRISQYKPGFLKSPYLVIYGLFFFLGLISFIYILLKELVFATNNLQLKAKIISLFVIWISVLTAFLWIQTQKPIFFLN